MLKFYVQLSDPYMTTGKTVALTIWTSVRQTISHICMQNRDSLICWGIQRKLFLQRLKTPDPLLTAVYSEA